MSEVIKEEIEKETKVNYTVWSVAIIKVAVILIIGLVIVGIVMAPIDTTGMSPEQITNITNQQHVMVGLLVLALGVSVILHFLGFL